MLLFKEIVMAKAVQLSCKKGFAKNIYFIFQATFTDHSGHICQKRIERKSFVIFTLHLIS